MLPSRSANASKVENTREDAHHRELRALATKTLLASHRPLMSPPSPRSTRLGIGDLRDATLLLALSLGLGLASLGVRADVPWIAAEPEPAPTSCVLEDDEAWAPSMPHLGIDEVARRLETGHLTVVDARPAEAFARGHIPGAISLPSAEAEALLGVQTLPIPPGDLVVTYGDADGFDAETVGRLLDVSAGCSQVHVLEGGWSAWVASGQRVEAIEHDG
jgi:rhodanese-related sulfurtransferase